MAGKPYPEITKENQVPPELQRFSIEIAYFKSDFDLLQSALSEVPKFPSQAAADRLVEMAAKFEEDIPRMKELLEDLRIKYDKVDKSLSGGNTRLKDTHRKLQVLIESLNKILGPYEMMKSAILERKVWANSDAAFKASVAAGLDAVDAAAARNAVARTIRAKYTKGAYAEYSRENTIQFKTRPGAPVGPDAPSAAGSGDGNEENKKLYEQTERIRKQFNKLKELIEKYDLEWRANASQRAGEPPSEKYLEDLAAKLNVISEQFTDLQIRINNLNTKIKSSVTPMDQYKGQAGEFLAAMNAGLPALQEQYTKQIDRLKRFQGKPVTARPSEPRSNNGPRAAGAGPPEPSARAPNRPAPAAPPRAPNRPAPAAPPPAPNKPRKERLQSAFESFKNANKEYETLISNAEDIPALARLITQLQEVLNKYNAFLGKVRNKPANWTWYGDNERREALDLKTSFEGKIIQVFEKILIKTGAAPIERVPVGEELNVLIERLTNTVRSLETYRMRRPDMTPIETTLLNNIILSLFQNFGHANETLTEKIQEEDRTEGGRQEKLANYQTLLRQVSRLFDIYKRLLPVFSVLVKTDVGEQPREQVLFGKYEENQQYLNDKIAMLENRFSLEGPVYGEDTNQLADRIIRNSKRWRNYIFHFLESVEQDNPVQIKILLDSLVETASHFAPGNTFNMHRGPDHFMGLGLSQEKANEISEISGNLGILVEMLRNKQAGAAGPGAAGANTPEKAECREFLREQGLLKSDGSVNKSLYRKKMLELSREANKAPLYKKIITCVNELEQSGGRSKKRTRKSKSLKKKQTRRRR